MNELMYSQVKIVGKSSKPIQTMPLTRSSAPVELLELTAIGEFNAAISCKADWICPNAVVWAVPACKSQLSSAWMCGLSMGDTFSSRGNCAMTLHEECDPEFQAFQDCVQGKSVMARAYDEFSNGIPSH